MSLAALVAAIQARGFSASGKRLQRQADAAWSSLFPAQRRFWEHPAKLRAQVCGRRAGKTSGAARAILAKALTVSNANVIVVETSRTSQASKTFQAALEQEAKRGGIALKPNRQELIYTLESGTRIHIMGAYDRRQADSIRGVERLALMYIDEPASFRPSVLEYILDEAGGAALMDLDGEVVLSGTPGAACIGPFYDITEAGKRSGWHITHWTARDNPHIAHATQWMEARRKERGWSTSHPVYLREYEGRWVKDLESLCYPYLASRNAADGLPDVGGWSYYLGLDYGYIDSTAWVVWATSPHTPVAYCVESGKASGLTPSDAAERVRMLDSRYRFTQRVGDTGGIGKAYVEEVRKRFGIRIQPADKREKRAGMEFMAGSMRDGLVKWIVGANADYVEEMSVLQWNEQRTEPDPRFADHLCDGGIYGYKATPHYLYQPPKPGPANPLEAWQQMADEDFDLEGESRSVSIYE